MTYCIDFTKSIIGFGLYTVSLAGSQTSLSRGVQQIYKVNFIIADDQVNSCYRIDQ